MKIHKRDKIKPFFKSGWCISENHLLCDSYRMVPIETIKLILSETLMYHQADASKQIASMCTCYCHAVFQNEN